MPKLQSGSYQIFLTRPGQKFLTMQGPDVDAGSPVVTAHPTGNIGEQDWNLEALSGDCVTLRNSASGKYAGYEGQAQVELPITAMDHPTAFELEPGNEPAQFRLRVPSELTVGEVLYLGLSPELVAPTRVVLRPEPETWEFLFLFAKPLTCLI